MKREYRRVDNKVNDLRYAVKFENHVKNKNIFLLSKTFLFFKSISFYSWKSINCLSIFFAEADTKKHRYASAKALAFANC